MKNILQLFQKPLHDLGETNPEFEGIYSPLYDREEISRFMTPHYESLEGAKAQVQSFDLTKFYYGLIMEALRRADFTKRKQPLKILDVGCGFGSTTFPLLKIFPKAEIVASELSAPMLYELKQKLARHKDKDRCHLLQLNAEELDFKENSFDLIVGAAILHHLFNPEKTIKSCAKILKPGGVAIFFEPFEEGTSLMALIYETIIHHGGFKWLDLSFKIYFRHAVSLWWKMKNPNKSDQFFENLDDKWLFNRGYYQKYAKEYCFKDCLIYRHDESDQPFTHLVQNHLAAKLNKMPKWIFEIIDTYEKWLTKEQKDELITEGGIILKK
ncbi:MAG: class I SAM-dependent methyltransferase [Patescibacteria group bacterium]|nr:class I SAM-dependent methyltransferase [Patescibacteria group bacterium]